MALQPPRSGTQQHKLLGAYAEAARNNGGGLLDDEVAAQLNDPTLPPQRVAARRHDLAERGWLVSGDERRTSKGAWATEWHLSAEGAHTLGIENGGLRSAGDTEKKSWFDREAEKIVQKLEDKKKGSQLRAAVQRQPCSAKTARVLKAKTDEIEREQRRKEREEVDQARINAERLEKIADPYAPAHRLFAELRDMEIRLGGFESSVKQAPEIFAVRPDLVGLAEDVANAAYDLMDLLKGAPAPEAIPIPPKKRQALPPTDA